MRATATRSRPLLPGTTPARSRIVLPALALAAILLAGCGGHSGPAVPSLGSGSGSAGGGASTAARLHAAAQCVRQHGIPSFADPVRSLNGAVYFDLRSIQNAPRSVQSAVRAACAALISRTGIDSLSEPPAPPQLVQAGVRAAECMRAHGLPSMLDPTSRTPYTPGHGFGLTAAEVPGGKLGPGFQEAGHACRTLLDAEIRASTLSSLGSDG
jgi:hypothetical protein